MGWRRRGSGGSGGGGVGTPSAFVSVKLFGAVGDGVHDDTAAIQTGVNSTASAGQGLWFPKGTYLVSASIVPANNSYLWGPEATIKSTIAPLDGFTNSVLFQTPNATELGTVSGGIVLGGLTVNVTGLGVAPTIGQGLFLLNQNNGNDGLVYQITNVVAGEGAYTLTVDRPIQKPFQVGDHANVLSTWPRSIVIDGLTFVGTGDRYVELVGSWDCTIRDCNFDGSTPAGCVGSVAHGGAAASFDIGGYNNQYDHCRAWVTGALVTGFGVESQEHTIVRDVLVRKFGNTGIASTDSVYSNIINCEVTAGAVGISVGSQGGGTYGPQQCAVVGSAVTDCTTVGISIAGVAASAGLRTTDCSVQRCAIGYQTGGAACFFENCSANNCSNIGFNVQAGSSLYGTNLNVDTCANGVWGLGPVRIQGLSALNVTNVALVFVSGCDGSKVSDAVCTTAAATLSVEWDSTGRGEFVHCNFTSAGAQVIQTSAGYVVVKDCTISGGTVRAIYNGGVAVKDDGGNDYSGSAAGITNGAGSYSNRGTFNSAVGAVTIHWPEMQANDQIVVTPLAAASTGYVSAQTVGTGFNWTDTGVHSYSYAIV